MGRNIDRASRTKIHSQYAPLNPPDIKTLSCADAATGQNSAVVRMTNDKALMIGSSPALSDAPMKLLAHTPAGDPLDCRILIFDATKVMSALSPKAYMCGATRDVRFGPKADIAPRYSITSSARASSAGGTVMPSAFAVLRLIASTYLVGP